MGHGPSSDPRRADVGEQLWCQDKLAVGEREYEIFRLGALQRDYDVARLPFSLKVLLENLLRTEGNGSVSRSRHRGARRAGTRRRSRSKEIAFTPARVLMQDFTGVPAVVDLAAMRDAMAEMGGDPARINPLAPAELVIDHSVQVDAFGTRDAFRVNAEREFERNQERYVFLRWGQGAFEHFAVVPPDTGIVHQVNLEYLARVVFDDTQAAARPTPTRCVGTDSHTTMVNGLGVLGWGVGGIEAEAAMLGQPVSMLIPQVLGFSLHGEMPEGATATDLVLTVTERLRERGVVGMFVEFYGPGLRPLPIADRATIGNMSPEFGSTCAIFPIDAETLAYLRSRAARRAASSWSRPTPASRACGTTSTPRARLLGELELDLARSCRARRSPAPPGPDPAARRQGGLPRGAGRDTCPSDERRPRRGDGRELSGLDPPADGTAPGRAGRRRPALPAPARRRSARVERRRQRGR